MVIYYRVSIPFIAGQWSLHSHRCRKFHRFCCFNPLHCGAVVASCFLAETLGLPILVSIPFIAGQWSLLELGVSVGVSCFLVSIPFIAGQWSLPSLAVWRAWVGEQVSIPFIAGQWSLLRHVLENDPALAAFQSPSLRGSGRFWLDNFGSRAGGPRFNPLHCGAVVASTTAARRRRERRRVSIPFIAGQWSLLPRTTPSSLFGVLLRKRRLPCDHIICTRLPF